MRRLLRSFALLGPVVLVGLFVWVVGRGSWAESPREPAPGEPPLAQVVDGELGRHVRAVVRVPYSIEEVWQVLTDHDRYADVCPYLHQPKFEPDPDRTTHLTGRIQGWANTFPLDLQLRQEQLLDEYRSSWDGGEGEVLANRGHWSVRRLGPRESLLEVAVAVEVRRVPTFLLRILLRDRLRVVLANVQARLDESAENW